MLERQRVSQPEGAKEPNYRKVISDLFQTRHPIVALAKVCSGVPYFLPKKKAKEIFEEGGEEAIIKLAYYCLPTLLKAIKEYYSWCGIDERGLFEVAFAACLEAAWQWHPGRQLKIGARNPEKPPTFIEDTIRGFASRKIHRALQESIVRRYGLQGVYDLPVVKLFRRCWLDFVAVTHREPTIEEMEEWIRAENKERGLNLKLDLEKGGGRESKIKIIYRHIPCLNGFSGDEPPWPDSEALEREAIRRELIGQITYTINSALTARQREVINLWLEGKTLEDIRKALNITRNRVRQILAAAISKIRKETGRPPR
jgi:RNA polymerase sigma factor (sigma-70 family)